MNFSNPAAGARYTRHRGASPTVAPRRITAGEPAEQLQLAATTVAAVLITTSSAVASENFARAIHVLRASARPFILLRLARLANPEDANKRCGHAIQAAADGTLFIPNLQRASDVAQHVLLELLPKCPVQIVSAATPDLFAAVQRGGFSTRLFYRLNILHFHIDAGDPEM